MIPMDTTPLETPIGIVNLGATARGLRMLEFPVRQGRNEPSYAAAATRGDVAAAAHLAEACEQVTEYFDGKRTEFALRLDWTGVTGLRLTVLQLLAAVPFGATTTYGELAKGAGSPSASQAVGAIMGSNPLPIVVPCHRVLAADGLGGFGGGPRTKEWLLAWEGALPPALFG